MKPYVLRRRALSDIDAIRDYTRSAWGADQARNYISDLRHMLAKIAGAPMRFPLVEGRDDGLRRGRAGSHLVVYQIVGDRIEIVRILHDRMDTDTQLG